MPGPTVGIYGLPTRIPAIPDVRSAKVEDVIAAVKEWVEVREGTRGDGLDRAVTLRDLLNSGLATPFDLRDLNPGSIAPPLLWPGGQDPDVPPTPEALEATGAFKYILLTWQFARAYSRLAYFEIWRSTTNAVGDAVKIAQTFGLIYADEVGQGQTYYYWVRAVSDAPAVSPFSALEGTLGQTAIDPGYLIALLTGQITESQLHEDLGSRIDLIDGAAALAGSVNARLTAVRSALEGEIAQNGSAIVTLQDATEAQALSITQLGTRTGTAESNITTLQQTTGAQAQSITQLSSTVGGHTTTIQTQQTSLNGLSAQYTVKVDNNGWVSGFGLASTAVNGVPSSAWYARVDSFIVGTPGLYGAAPFLVRTTPTTIGGVSVPAGVYMTDAFIQNGSIANAKIGNLAVDNAKIANMSAEKITAGYLDSARIEVGSLNGNRITVRTLTADRIAANSVTASEMAANSILASAIGAKQVTAEKINVVSLAAMTAIIGTLRTATSGARTEISDNVIKVFGSNNVVRVQIGDLDA